jgi:Zn-dependent protease
MALWVSRDIFLGVLLGIEIVSANTIYLVTIWAIPVIIAITFHEAAHGFVALLLGDNTAWRLGRVSFNPLKHVDPFGTILLPGVLLLVRSPFIFGYAKPVPINFRALRWPRRDMVLVAAAGPAMNIALAVAAALAFHIVGGRTVATLRAADLGARTVLIARDEFGGMAANDGPIPVRVLSQAARLDSWVDTASR